MNERIRELIKQAADQTSAAFSSSNFRQSEWESDFREKFAELLIKECTTKMALEIMNNSWVDDAVKSTHQHFGLDQ